MCLSLIATAASTWLQFRKPHQLWAIYRTAQRHIESHMVKFRFEVDEYSDEKEREKLLAKHATQIALAAHDLWVPLIPSPEGLERPRPASSAKLLPARGKEPPETNPPTGYAMAQKAE